MQVWIYKGIAHYCIAQSVQEKSGHFLAKSGQSDLDGDTLLPHSATREGKKWTVWRISKSSHSDTKGDTLKRIAQSVQEKTGHFLNCGKTAFLKTRAHAPRPLQGVAGLARGRVPGVVGG